jgi:hypothetical protein
LADVQHNLHPDAWLEDVLTLVPKGGFQQNLFRAELHSDLSAALVTRNGSPRSPADVVDDTTARIRLEYPSFQPRFHARLLSLGWPEAGAAPR